MKTAQSVWFVRTIGRSRPTRANDVDFMYAVVAAGITLEVLKTLIAIRKKFDYIMC